MKRLFILVVFFLSQSLSWAQNPTVTPIHSFFGGDGGWPMGGLIYGPGGYFYGTCSTDSGGNGTIYRCGPTGSFSMFVRFSGYPTEGTSPYCGLVRASDGNFYGTTYIGGANKCGTIYRMAPNGTLTTLYSFDGAPACNPYAPLMQAKDGYLYGTTYNNPSGYIYRMDLSGNVTVLRGFGGNLGGYPQDGLIQGSDGNFYGTTDCCVFQFIPPSTINNLYTFTGGNDGSTPTTSLIEGPDGYFYGTTQTSIFKITSGGSFTLLHTFTGSDGYYCESPLTLGSDGRYYGACSAYVLSGGNRGPGTLFRISSDGTFELLYTFSQYQTWNHINTEGGSPNGTLAEGPDGNFYGTAYDGGPYGSGTVFRLNLIPVIQTISPASIDAGGAEFTLTAKGYAFRNTSYLTWNGTQLTTSFVSENELKAQVPASMLASPGTIKVAADTPGNMGGTSRQTKTFTVLVTTLKLLSASLSKTSNGTYTASLNLKNMGYLAANNVIITKASLDASATSTTLPVSMGNIAAGATGSTALTFPSSAGTSGSTVYLKVAGMFTGGKFGGSLKLTLP